MFVLHKEKRPQIPNMNMGSIELQTFPQGIFHDWLSISNIFLFFSFLKHKANELAKNKL